MIDQKEYKNQHSNEIQPAFKELKVLKHLRNAGFEKRFGLTCAYLFQLIFGHKNWSDCLKAKREIHYWKKYCLSFFKPCRI